MLILRILFLIIVLQVGRCAEFSLTKNNNNYGPYVMTFKQYELCKGFKRTNATTIRLKVNTDKNGFMVIHNMTFHVNTLLGEMKIHVWHFNGNQKMTLWNYKVDKPCQHFAISSILANYFDLQQNCIVKKGDYYFTVNLNKVAGQFFGDSFFYGEFSFKVTSLSNQGNIMCVIVDILFSKKTE